MEWASGTSSANGAAPILPYRQKIFVVQNADDPVGASFEHWKPRVSFAVDDAQHLIEGGIGWNRNYILPGHHNGADQNSTKIEHPMDDVFLRFRKISQAAAGANNEFQLVG